MDNLFEGVMLTCICVAMVIMMIRFAKQRSIHIKRDRALVITFCIGLVFGAIGKATAAPVEWTFALYVVGAYLSYTAAVFSFPQLGNQNKVSENE